MVTTEEARALSLEVLAGKPRSYTNAAVLLAKFVEEGTRVVKVIEVE